MRFVLRALYAAAARLANVASLVTPPSDSKTSIAMRARRRIRLRYARWAESQRDETRPLLWIHAPSVGEGLMARPVLALIRARHPEVQLAYTFFSPSAEEFSRTLDVDFRDYLPFDSGADMRAALSALRPRALVFSKVDVWPELVRQAQLSHVKLGMISAALSAHSGRRSRLATMLLSDAYAALDAVGAVDAGDADRLVELGVRREVIEVTGDTRFDQVWQRVEASERGSRLLASLASDRATLVAGSTWPADEEPLLEAFARVKDARPEMRLVIAPHELSAVHLDTIVEWSGRRRLNLARIDESAAAKADVILVDRYGVLADLYSLADVAFVGGGFHSAGLHSVVEPAAFGAPVLFGPMHDRSRDARLLLDAGAARACRDTAELAAALMQWFGNDAARRLAGENAREVVKRGIGAAERSLRIVERLLF